MYYSDVMKEIESMADNIPDLLVDFEGKPIKAWLLSSFWRHACHIIYDDMQIAGLSSKQAIYMRAIAKASDDRILERLGTVVAEWPSFVVYLRNRTGEKSKPTRPNLGLIAANANEFREFTEAGLPDTTTKPKGKTKIVSPLDAT